jgi:hypothetical protein
MLQLKKLQCQVNLLQIRPNFPYHQDYTQSVLVQNLYLL